MVKEYVPRHTGTTKNGKRPKEDFLERANTRYFLFSRGDYRFTFLLSAFLSPSLLAQPERAAEPVLLLAMMVLVLLLLLLFHVIVRRRWRIVLCRFLSRF